VNKSETGEKKKRFNTHAFIQTCYTFITEDTNNIDFTAILLFLQKQNQDGNAIKIK
jgi:hypothetical protein